MRNFNFSVIIVLLVLSLFVSTVSADGPTVNQTNIQPSSAIPSTDSYINATVYDLNSTGITYVNFTLFYPDSSVVFSQINGTRIGIGEWHSRTFNISGDSSLGNWTYNISMNDVNGTTASYSSSFLVVDTSAPSINFSYPTNNTIYYSNYSIGLNYSVGDNVNISWCGYSLNDGVTNTTISSCLTNLSFFFKNINGTFNITLFANDTSNNRIANKVQNITIQYDITRPSLTVSRPSSETALSFPVTISASDSGILSYCFFNITTTGGSTVQGNTQIISCNNATGTVGSNGTYIINVFANDTTGNINFTSRNFTVAVTEGSSGSGGGGAGGSSGLITVSESQFVSGYSQTLDAGDYFRINISSAYHTVTLASVKNTSVTIIVASTPQTAMLNVSQSRLFDVTGDGNNDLRVTLDSINFNASTARLTVMKVSAPGSSVNNNVSIPQNTSNQGVGTGTLGEERLISSSTWWVIGVVGAIIILFVLIAIIVTQYQKYKERTVSKRIRVYAQNIK